MAATAHTLKKESELRFEVERGQCYTIKVGLTLHHLSPTKRPPSLSAADVARRIPFHANSTSPFPSPPASPAVPVQRSHITDLHHLPPSVSAS
jgi:hypothetical protein